MPCIVKPKTMVWDKLPETLGKDIFEENTQTMDIK